MFMTILGMYRNYRIVMDNLYRFRVGRRIRRYGSLPCNYLTYSPLSWRTSFAFKLGPISNHDYGHY